MRPSFEELDRRPTPMGEISLRRRLEPTLQVDVYEAKLDDEYLMSSLFTVAEIELARLGLARATGRQLDVVVGGLGLGYTACEALADERVGRVTVVDALAEVIDWHRRRLLPFAHQLTTDARCRLHHADFFATVADGRGFADDPKARHDVVLLDVDHAPDRLLHPSHAAFYTAEGLGLLAGLLRPGGVFALWSDDPPDPAFLAVLGEVFATADAEPVTFPNPFTGEESANTVYLATVST